MLRARLAEALTRTTSAANPAAAAAGDLQFRLRVLLVEDNVTNQKVAQLMLGRLHHRVDTVANGAEAVEAVRRSRYDVVLMDVQMPVMDGIQATRAIRAEVPADRQPRIIAMTANVLVEDQAACRDAGMDDYLPKPVSAADLAAVLATPSRPGAVHPTTLDQSASVVPATSTTADADSAEISIDTRVALITARLADITGPTPPPAEQALIDRLITSFITRTPAAVDDLADAIRRGDTGEVAARAHALKGSAANLGADTLADLFARLDDLARTGRLPTDDEPLHTIRRETDATLQALTTFTTDVRR